MPEDSLPLIGAFGGQCSSEIGGTAPPAAGSAVADAVALAVAEAEADSSATTSHPMDPSPIPLPLSASWHCCSRERPQIPRPPALASSWASANLLSYFVFGG